MRDALSRDLVGRDQLNLLFLVSPVSVRTLSCSLHVRFAPSTAMPVPISSSKQLWRGPPWPIARPCRHHKRRLISFELACPLSEVSWMAMVLEQCFTGTRKQQWGTAQAQAVSPELRCLAKTIGSRTQLEVALISSRTLSRERSLFALSRLPVSLPSPACPL